MSSNAYGADQSAAAAPAKQGKLKSFFSRFSNKNGVRERSKTWHGSEAPSNSRSGAGSPKGTKILPYAPTAEEAHYVRSDSGLKLNPGAKFGYGTNPRLQPTAAPIQSSLPSEAMAAGVGAGVVAVTGMPAIVQGAQARHSVLEAGRFETATGTTRGMISGIGNGIPVSSGYTISPLSSVEASSAAMPTPGQPLSSSSQSSFVTPGQPISNYNGQSDDRSYSPTKPQHRSSKSEAQDLGPQLQQTDSRVDNSEPVTAQNSPRLSMSSVPAVAEKDLVLHQILLKESEARLGAVKTTGLDAKRSFTSAAQSNDAFLTELSNLKFQSIPPQLQDFYRSQVKLRATMQQYHANLEQLVLTPSGAMTERDAEIARAVAAKKNVQSAKKDLDSAAHSYDKVNVSKRDRVLAAQTHLDEATQRYQTAATGFFDSMQTLELRKATVFGSNVDYVMSELAAGLKEAVSVIEAGLRDRNFSAEEFAARNRIVSAVEQQQGQQQWGTDSTAAQGWQSPNRLSVSEAQRPWDQQASQSQNMVIQGPVHHQVPVPIVQPMDASTVGGGQMEPAISRVSTDAITDVSWRPAATNLESSDTSFAMFPQQQVFSSPPSSLATVRKTEGQANPVPTSSMYPPQNSYSQGFTKQLPTLNEEHSASGEQSASASPLQFQWNKDGQPDSEEESGLGASSKRRRSRIGVFAPQGEEASAQALISPRNQPPGLTKQSVGKYDYASVGMPSAHSDVKREIV